MLGVGPLEIGVILLIAFLVLGPSTSIDMARKVGKVVRDLRGSFTDIAAAVDLKKDERPANRQTHLYSPLLSGEEREVAPTQDSEEHPAPRDQQ